MCADVCGGMCRDVPQMIWTLVVFLVVGVIAWSIYDYRQRWPSKSRSKNTESKHCLKPIIKHAITHTIKHTIKRTVKHAQEYYRAYYHRVGPSCLPMAFLSQAVALCRHRCPVTCRITCPKPSLASLIFYPRIGSRCILNYRGAARSRYAQFVRVLHTTGRSRLILYDRAQLTNIRRGAACVILQGAADLLYYLCCYATVLLCCCAVLLCCAAVLLCCCAAPTNFYTTGRSRLTRRATM